MSATFEEEFARSVEEDGLLSREEIDACRATDGRLDLAHVFRAAGFTAASFGRLAVERKYITPDQLDEALVEQKNTPAEMLGQILIRRKWLTTPQFLEILRAQQRTPARPQRIGKYQLLEVVGEGGMGIVYRARDLELDRVVALKVLRAGDGADRRQIERFHREAQNAARLHHPGIVTVYEAGRDGETLYFTMEYVAGSTLDRLRLEPRAAAALVKEVAHAVHYAHAQGIVHRDLKPQNIVVDAAGRPHILDFGLSRAVDAPSPLTRSGAVMGTPHYMSPEQVRGQADWKSDIYALGVILYQALAGRPPFAGETAYDVYRSIIADEPPPLGPKIHRDLSTLCLKAMEKDAVRRYASAEAMADELGRYLQGEPILARPSGALTHMAKRIRRQPALWGGVALMILAAGISGSFALRALRARESEDRARRREEAVRVYEKALEEVRQFETGLPFAKDVAEVQPHLTRAREILTAGVAAYPEHAPLHYLHARVLYLADEVGPASDELKRADEDAEALLLRGKILVRRYQAEQGLPPFIVSGSEPIIVDRPGESEEIRAVKLEAMQAFNRCLELARSAGSEERLVADLGYARGVLALMEGRLDDAKRELDACLKTRGFDADAYAARAMARFFSKDMAGARDDVNQAIKLRPTYAEAYVYRSYIGDVDRNFEAILADLDKAIQLNPKLAIAYHARSYALREIGATLEDGREHFRRAVEDATSALNIRPGYWIARLNRGTALMMLGHAMQRRGEDAIPVLRSAIEDYDAYLAQKERPYGSTFMERGNCHFNIGRALRDRNEDPTISFDKAREDYDRAIRIAPDFGLAILQRTNVEWAAARWAVRRKQDPIPLFERGLEKIALLLKQDPDHVQGLLYRGGILNELAEAELERGIDPAARWRESEETHARVIAGAPRHAEALAGRGWARYRLRRFKEAIEDFEAAIAADASMEPKVRGALDDSRRQP